MPSSDLLPPFKAFLIELLPKSRCLIPTPSPDQIRISEEVGITYFSRYVLSEAQPPAAISSQRVIGLCNKIPLLFLSTQNQETTILKSTHSTTTQPLKMKSTFLLTLLPAVLAAPNLMQGRQDSTTTTTSAPTTTTSDLPCPTNPDNCAARGGHLICLNAGVWCRYTDPTRGTPAFFPVDLAGPCPSCLPSW
ncbi:hypothetical protein F4810DRAFT_713599 [Camillea tinctor]|nr:hypothetical protein F4810DRAFT_713599 [Camillea tinctor]